MTSATTAIAAAEERSAGWVCWSDKDGGLGGFTYVKRLKLVILQTTGMGFFGLYSSTTALASTTHIPAATQLVSPRNFMDIGSTGDGGRPRLLGGRCGEGLLRLRGIERSKLHAVR
ncbi:hypothetical protein [Rhodobacteraceae bacterium DSL-40]|uniref:hypothetical protein n=1 Tax=Amaricoccus sp. B4 TaxID=3368557 RepID=UPI0013A68EE0